MPTGRTPKTHCVNGHKRTEKNTYIRPDGWRECRTCRRTQKLQKNYGMTSEDYDRMLEEQNGRCAICRNQPRTKLLVVDHNHKTGQVRGLLCDRCNRTGLGAFHDDYEIVQRAEIYLTANDAPFHPPLEILEYMKDLENALKEEGESRVILPTE